MAISYDVRDDGHVIIAKATGEVTGDEFVEFEVAHAVDERVHPPVAELLLVEQGALEGITFDDMRRVIARRTEIDRKPTPHRCGIVVGFSDSHAWNLAKFYEAMVILHSPETVIVFADERTARIWLGLD